MKWLPVVMAAMLRAAEGKSVSAHFMLANSYSYSLSDWQYDIKAAQDAKIDSFALNMAYNPSTALVSLTKTCSNHATDMARINQ